MISRKISYWRARKNWKLFNFFITIHEGYALSGYASSNYVFDSLDAAQTRCIELSDLCAGVTKESSTRYTTRANYKFSSNSNYESWTKEVIWAANFVPRAQWGARPPKDITTFNNGFESK